MLEYVSSSTAYFLLLLCIGSVLLLCRLNRSTRQHAFRFVEYVEKVSGAELGYAKCFFFVDSVHSSGAIRIDSPKEGSSAMYVHRGRSEKQVGSSEKKGVLPNTVETNKRKREGESVPDDMTQVRVDGWPTFRWKHGRGTFAGASLKVRNIGSRTARGIKVHLRFPGGDMLKLNGPQQLEPNKRGVYVSNEERGVGRGRVKTKISCSNCYK